MRAAALASGGLAFTPCGAGATLDAAIFVDQATCSYSPSPATESAGSVPLAPLLPGVSPQGRATLK